jgi:uncharacterized damage-inducible protein DinB
MYALTEHFRTMASYNQWMNRKLYKICACLSDEQRKRDLGAFFRSIHGTLNHILLADRAWMGRFTGASTTFKSLDQELYTDFERLLAEREKDDRRIISWVMSLNDNDLGDELRYTGMTDPQPRKYPLWFALSHFFNHQAHHRGQTTTMIKQLGIDPGVTDLIMLPEFQS